MADLSNKLKKYLVLEVDCARQLSLLIRDEQQALAALNDKLIVLNTQRKQELIDTLQEATRGRIALMQEMGFSPDRDGVTACLETSGQDPELVSLFSNLNNLARECAEENRTAGQLIHRRSSFLTRAIDNIVRNNPVKSGLYQANGKTDPLSHSRHLTST